MRYDIPGNMLCLALSSPFEWSELSPACGLFLGCGISHIHNRTSSICTDDHIIEVVITSASIVGLFVSFMLIMLSYVFIFPTILHILTTDGRHTAFSTYTSHLTVVTVQYGFASVIYFKPNAARALNDVMLLSILYTLITPFLSSMIFILKNKEMEVAFKKAI
ncbi:Olfactory receptor 10H1, partial [Ophiophagus hannah]